METPRAELRTDLFRRLARLGLAGMDRDSCLHLMREVLREMKLEGRISDYWQLNVRMARVGAGDLEPYVEVRVRFDRGFREELFFCPQAHLVPEMIPVMEVLAP